MTHQKCSVCKLRKPFAAFYRHKAAKSGFGSRCKTCTIAYVQAWVAANPEKAARNKRAARLLKQYGLSAETYEIMWNVQGGRCVACDQPETRCHKSGTPYSLSVDHDHETGLVRGLLCHGCNVGIGYLRHDPETLERAAAYLRSATTSDPAKAPPTGTGSGAD